MRALIDNPNPATYPTLDEYGIPGDRRRAADRHHRPEADRPRHRLRHRRRFLARGTGGIRSSGGDLLLGFAPAICWPTASAGAISRSAGSAGAAISCSNGIVTSPLRSGGGDITFGGTGGDVIFNGIGGPLGFGGGGGDIIYNGLPVTALACNDAIKSSAHTHTGANMVTRTSLLVTLGLIVAAAGLAAVEARAGAASPSRLDRDRAVPGKPDQITIVGRAYALEGVEGRFALSIKRAGKGGSTKSGQSGAFTRGGDNGSLSRTAINVGPADTLTIELTLTVEHGGFSVSLKPAPAPASARSELTEAANPIPTDMIIYPANAPPEFVQIILATCEVLGVKEKDLKGRSRNSKLSFACQVAAYIVRGVWPQSQRKGWSHEPRSDRR